MYNVKYFEFSPNKNDFEVLHFKILGNFLNKEYLFLESYNDIKVLNKYLNDINQNYIYYGYIILDKYYLIDIFNKEENIFIDYDNVILESKRLNIYYTNIMHCDTFTSLLDMKKKLYFHFKTDGLLGNIKNIIIRPKTKFKLNDLNNFVGKY